MQTVRSFCRVCTSVCGILVDVEGDEVIRGRGDQDHPFAHGYTCPKGRALPQLHHHSDRLERPQMRVGSRLQDTTWDACLDDLGTLDPARAPRGQRNRLTNKDDIDVVTGMVRYSGIPVSLHPA